MMTTEHTHELDVAEVGDGLTHLIYSDRVAMTIIKRTAKTITAQRDKATLLNGMNSDAEDALMADVGGFAAHVTGRQRYEYEADPEGGVYKFSRRVLKSGQVRWVLCGHPSGSPGNSASGGRNEFYDYNF